MREYWCWGLFCAAVLAGCAGPREIKSGSREITPSEFRLEAEPSKRSAFLGIIPLGAKPETPYRWGDDETKPGKVSLKVLLREQKMEVYRGGELVGEALISTGKPGYFTPTGNFTILEKKKDHVSNRYGAYVKADTGEFVSMASVRDPVPEGLKYIPGQMPWMQRLTYTGVCIHQGDIREKFSSFGCIRVPEGFAEKLYHVTQVGTPVVVRETEGNGI